MIRYHDNVRPFLVDPSKIRPHPENPNNGDVDTLIGSILTNGCYRPIYAAADGTILAGHHLYAALMELEATQVPVMFLDSESNTDESTRILLADNKVADLARMDHGLEAQLLAQLDDYAGTGYTEREVSDLLERIDSEEAFVATDLDPSVPTFGSKHTCPSCGHEWEEQR